MAGYKLNLSFNYVFDSIFFGLINFEIKLNIIFTDFESAAPTHISKIKTYSVL